ncbi:TadE/TadG family type IV pilus assembly protein [Tessaracoccus sp. G1721]
MTGNGGERGLAMSVEAVVILPVLVLFIGLVISLARIAIAEQSVGAAAAAAARSASLERSSSSAQSAALEAARLSLAQRHVACRTTDVAVDAAGVGRALGQRATVEVEVRCLVELRDVSLPFVPGSVSVTAARTSPVDPLRGR